jgi:hypothetical protein
VTSTMRLILFKLSDLTVVMAQSLYGAKHNAFMSVMKEIISSGSTMYAVTFIS